MLLISVHLFACNDKKKYHATKTTIMLNNIPSCKIANAVLESKWHLSSLFINPKTVSKQRLLKGETIMLLIPYQEIYSMFTICVAVQLFC